MDKLWAPWRIKYLTQKKEKTCLFCRVQAQESDKKNHIILRSQYCFVLLNRFPYNNGHLLIAPYKHTCSLERLKTQEIIDIHETTVKIKKGLVKTLKPDGFNLGLNIGKAAGAGITGHLHFHLVPRWIGDTNFMPLFSETKVISESLNALYNKLSRNIK